MRGVLVRIQNFSTLLEIRRYTAKLRAKLKLSVMAQRIQLHVQSGLTAYGKQSSQKNSTEFGGASRTEREMRLFGNGRNNLRGRLPLRITFLR